MRRAPAGFVWAARKDGRIEIHHRGRLAAILRGAVAQRLLAELPALDESARQQRLARLTGHYRHGNER